MQIFFDILSYEAQFKQQFGIFLIIQKNPVVVNCMFSAFCGKTLFVLRQKPPKAAKFEKNLPKTLAEIGKSVYSLTAYEKNYL